MPVWPVAGLCGHTTPLPGEGSPHRPQTRTSDAHEGASKAASAMLSGQRPCMYHSEADRSSPLVPCGRAVHISPSIIIVHMAPTSRHSLLFLPPGRDYSRSSRPVAHRRRPHRPPLQWCNSSDAGSSCQPGPISIPTSRQPSPPSPPSDNFPRHCQIEHIGKHASSCGACACSCSADHQRGLRIPAWSRTRDERRNIRVGVKCEGEGAD